jgi:hypothetical protein
MARVQLLFTTVTATKDQSLAEVKSVRVAVDPSVDSACQVDAIVSALALSELGKERTWMAFDARDRFDVSKIEGRRHYRLRKMLEEEQTSRSATMSPSTTSSVP